MTDEYPYGDTFSLQPLVDRVTVEKKVFDTLQKNNLDLTAKLEAIRTTIVDIFDKDTKDGEVELYREALIRIEKTIREYRQ